MSSYPTLPLVPTTRDRRRARAARPVSATTTRCIRCRTASSSTRCTGRINCGSVWRSRCTRSSWSLASRSPSQAGWRRTCRSSTATRSATTASCSTRSRSTRRWATTSTSMQQHERPIPNENYAREVLQLFSIGTVRLNPDGTQQLDDERPAGPDLHAGRRQQLRPRVHRLAVRRRRPAPGVPNYIDPMVANEAQHDIGAKTLLNGVVLPAGQNTTKDLNDCDRQHLQRSERRAVHLEAADPASGHEQSEPRICRARRGGVQRRRTGARGDLQGGGPGHPARPGGARRRQDGSELRPPAPSGAVHRQPPARVQREVGRRQRESDGYLNPQSARMGMDVFRPPSVFSYFSPATGVPGAAACAAPSSGSSRPRPRFARPTSSTRWCSRRIAVGTNAPSGTSLDLAPLQALAGNPGDAGRCARTCCCCTARCRARCATASSTPVAARVAATNTLKRARTAVYLVA